jgi:tRNA pseudouridine55 synthase
VNVRELVVVDFAPPYLRFRVRCSSGTYVRSLARDLGEALAVGAHLTHLRRTTVGSFDVATALQIDELADPAKVSGAWIEPLDALSHLPRVEVDSTAAEELAHGRSIDAEGLGDGEPVVAACRGALVAVGEVRRASFLPRKVFTSA